MKLNFFTEEMCLILGLFTLSDVSQGTKHSLQISADHNTNKEIPVDMHINRDFFVAEQDTPDHGWQIGCTPLKPTYYHQERELNPYIFLVHPLRGSFQTI